MNAEIATHLLSVMIASPGFYGVVAELDGKIAGSNFLDERGPISGVGPITVDPNNPISVPLTGQIQAKMSFLPPGTRNTVDLQYVVHVSFTFGVPLPDSYWAKVGGGFLTDVFGSAPATFTASFDVVLSNLCIHNIPDQEGRAQACREIARVLKPGGTALISDFILTGFYEKVFAAAGLKTSRTGLNFFTFPQLRVVKAQKK